MSESVQLRIASIFIILVASCSGIVLSIYGRKYVSDVMIALLNALSAGIMLGLCLIHLIADSLEILLDLYPPYNLCLLFVGVGICIVLSVEQIALSIGESMHSKSNIVVVSNKEIPITELSQKSSDKNETSSYQLMTPSTKDVVNKDIEDGCHHDHHGVSNLLKTSGMRQLLSAYVLEISISIHSIIIGVDLGLLTGTSEVVILLIVLCFHQFAEGFSLGSIIGDVRESLNETKVVTFIVIFSCTVPLGVLIGLLTSTQTSGEEATAAVVSSIAAGTMLYICLHELINQFFNQVKYSSNILMKVSMVSMFILGYAIMAIIGIWA